MGKLAIIGAGGHGKVVADAAIKSNKYQQVVFLDSRYRVLKNVMGLSVAGDDSYIPNFISEGFKFVVAIGDNQIRERVFLELMKLGADIGTVIHPAAQVADGVTIQSGTVIFARAVINPDTKISQNCIVNTGAVIEHDCNVGSHVHIAPNATVTGGVQIGERTLIGAGATIIPNKRVGLGSIVGAGAVVVKDIPDNTIATGIPARW